MGVKQLIADTTVRTLSSKWVFYVFGMLWIFNIWGSIWYLAAGPDDATFISIAFGFKYFGDLGLKYFSHFQELFIYLPAYPFAQALFYWLWDTIGLPINLFTYKVFNLLVLTLLMITSLRLISVIVPQTKSSQIFRFNIFMVVLAVSPFIIDSLYARPEPLGLLFTVCSLLLFDAAQRNVGWSWFLFSGAALLLGVAAVTHPTFIVTSGGLSFMAIIYLLQRKVYGSLAASTIAILLPLIAAASWFFAHQPESLEMLGRHVSGRSYILDGVGRGLRQMLEYMLLSDPSQSSLKVRLYYGLCFWTQFLTVLALMYLAVRGKFWYRIITANNSFAMVQCFFAFAFLNVVFDASARIQIYTVFAFASILALVILLPFRDNRSS